MATLLRLPSLRLSAKRLRPYGRQAALGVAVLAVLLVIGVIGAILPGSNQPLIWYVPVLDCATVVTLIVIVVLASADVALRRHARLLPVALSSLALAVVWLAHGLTFPQVLPSSLPFVSSQTAAYLFQLGHIGAAVLLAWILVQPTNGLQRPRLTLIKLLAATATLTILAIGLVAALALMLPPLVKADRFTTLNDVLQAVPVAVIFAAGAAYGRRPRPERRLQSALLTAMVLLALEGMTFLFMRSRYDGYWYLGHGLLVLPYGALFGCLRRRAARRKYSKPWFAPCRSRSAACRSPSTPRRARSSAPTRMA